MVSVTATYALTSVQKPGFTGPHILEEDGDLELTSVHHHVALKRVERVMNNVRQPSCRHADGEIAQGQLTNRGLLLRTASIGYASRVVHISLLEHIWAVLHDGTPGRVHATVQFSSESAPLAYKVVAGFALLAVWFLVQSFRDTASFTGHHSNS